MNIPSVGWVRRRLRRALCGLVSQVGYQAHRHALIQGVFHPLTGAARFLQAEMPGQEDVGVMILEHLLIADETNARLMFQRFPRAGVWQGERRRWRLRVYSNQL